jgi:biofilm PGA synthesis protein PgaA
LALAAPLAAAPSADLLPQIRAARDAGDLAGAERLARAAISTSHDPVYVLTLALVLTDQGRPAEALELLARPHEPPLPKLDRLRAEGYAHAKAGDSWAALVAYGEVLRLAPADTEARTSVAGLLDGLRGAHGAAALDGAPPRRQADMAAARTRWGGEVRSEDPAQRFEGTDRALADLDALLARLRADPAADPALIRRVRVDRMVALRDRVRMAEVLAEARELAPLPAFAEQAHADALLYSYMPAEASAAYDRVLAADPNNIQARYGRVFALVEQERHREAVAEADAILASRPRFVAMVGAPATTPDPEYAYAAQLAAETRLWADDVGEGSRRLDELAQGAPASASLRRARAGALSARGWPREAEQETRIAASLDPDSLWTRISRAETDLARERIAAAAEQSDTLLALAPENRTVQRLAQDVRARKGWQLLLDFAPAFNQGGGSFVEGEGYSFVGRLVTPEAIGRLRIVTFLESAAANPPEGRVTRNRAGAGLGFTGPDLSATAYATASWGSLPQPGAGVEAAWQIDDRWRISGNAEVNSAATPIRALLADISGNALNLALDWRRDERLSVSASVRTLFLSDSNDWVAAGASLVQQLHASEGLWLRGRVDAYASSNSKPGGPYFAPSSDLSLAAGIALEQRLWRRYQRQFTHLASVDAGVYDQAGYKASWIGVLRYEQRWRRDPWTEVFYSVGIDRRVYDGVGERGVQVAVGLRQRLG